MGMVSFLKKFYPNLEDYCFIRKNTLYPFYLLTGDDKPAFKWDDNFLIKEWDENLFQIPKEIEKKRAAILKGQKLWSDELCRLKDCWCPRPGERNVLELRLQKTLYEDFVVTNLQIDELRLQTNKTIREKFFTDIRNFASFQKSPLSSPLGTSVFVVNKDRMQGVMGLRSLDVGMDKGFFAIAGGHVNISKDTEKGKPNPFRTASRELKYEFGIETEANDLICLGIGVDLRFGHPNCLFLALTDADLTKVREFPKEERSEFEKYITLNLKNPKEVFKYLNPEKLSPNNATCTILSLEFLFPDLYGSKSKKFHLPLKDMLQRLKQPKEEKPEERIRESEKLKKIYKLIEECKKNPRKDKYVNEIKGNSEAMKEVIRFVEKVKDSNETVLLLGERGTGKGTVAKAIHDHGPRKNKDIVELNCGTIPKNLLESELFGACKGAYSEAVERKGKFEIADGSTIFLDEIGELEPEHQVKLLKIIEEKVVERVGGRLHDPGDKCGQGGANHRRIPVDIRIIAATNQDLTKKENFRPDLYDRLNILSFRLPSLREKKEDIPFLVNYFLQTTKTQKVFSRESMDKVLSYDWPGNVRELSNFVKKCILFAESETITEENVCNFWPQIRNAEDSFKEKRSEEQIIKELLIKHKNNKKKCFEEYHKLTGQSRATFFRKLKKIE